MKMKYYMAPIEGLTGYICRSTHRARYHPMDRYFTPFLSSKANSSLSLRELNDILPECNQGVYVVSQIFTNQTEDSVRTAKELQGYEYSEVNLNLGCPSGVVMSKYRGADLLGLPDSLDRSLDGVCGKVEGVGMELSVRTRLGLVSPDEFTSLLEIYNRYPLKKLTLHPRVRAGYYRSTPNTPAFGNGFDGGRAPVCCNGDVFTVPGYGTLRGDYPELNRVMLGRGIISSSGLPDRIVAGVDSGEAGTGKETLRKFHQMVYENYRTVMSGDKNILSKMKELWTCITQTFSNNRKYIKRIKKSQRLEEYGAAAAAVSQDPDTMGGAGFYAY